MSEHQVTIEEATTADASQLLSCLGQIIEETDYISDTELVASADLSFMEQFIEEQLQAQDRICLLVKVDDKVVGLVNLEAGQKESDSHIADLFIAIREGYQGYGLGSDLMALAVDWAEYSPQIKKLELEVQKRNTRALKLYEKFGFEIEGTRKKSAKTKNGEFLDLYLMGKVFEDKK
ncbi:GNAT family N-acetyltransferase [Streptococcus catagoni]|uniref:GNAT family N-acetyltransferase n=1 Tax=Streptococcus catagoni TaxID=2654874 RepID=UPI00140E2334|nr:GNAT family N-acetyltransferase [Streptococcus catagoni]